MTACIICCQLSQTMLDSDEGWASEDGLEAEGWLIVPLLWGSDIWGRSERPRNSPKSFCFSLLSLELLAGLRTWQGYLRPSGAGLPRYRRRCTCDRGNFNALTRDAEGRPRNECVRGYGFRSCVLDAE